ncbi:MAG: cytochrome c [Deltaproteobacteria bacterium]|nr:cytochrome c [Deltaproteobacteria bacterium]
MRYLFAAAAVLLITASGLGAETESQTVDTISQGEAVFGAHCVKCHGENATGTDKGSPLVHRFYHPNHHADITFRWAVDKGVRAHHWAFGDMPKIEGVSKDEVELVITYIRDLQKKAGIF